MQDERMTLRTAVCIFSLSTLSDMGEIKEYLESYLEDRGDPRSALSADNII